MLASHTPCSRPLERTTTRARTKENNHIVPSTCSHLLPKLLGTPVHLFFVLDSGVPLGYITQSLAPIHIEDIFPSNRIEIITSNCQNLDNSHQPTFTTNQTTCQNRLHPPSRAAKGSANKRYSPSSLGCLLLAAY